MHRLALAGSPIAVCGELRVNGMGSRSVPQQGLPTCFAYSSPSVARRKHLEGIISRTEGVARGGSPTPIKP